MSKIFFLKNNQKECIKSYNSFQIFVQQKHAPFYESTCSLDEFDEKLNHTKMLNFENLKERATRLRTQFKNHLIK